MPPPETLTYAIGPFLLDPANQRLTRDGEAVQLPAKAIGLLASLVTRAGRLVTREELLAGVWPGEDVDDNNLSVQIGALRRVLGSDPEFIETVPRRGYRFVGPVSVSGATATADLAPARPAPRRLKLGLLGAAVAGIIVISLVAAAPWGTGGGKTLPPPPALTLADSPPGARCCNVAVTLPSGLVLVVGAAGDGVRGVGNRVGDQFVLRREAVEYDPATYRMQIVRALRTEREAPTATLLSDGRVLVVGGWGCDEADLESARTRRPLAGRYCLASKRRPLDSAELYDPATKSFTMLDARLQVPRTGHTATLLNDGTVLIVGGYSGTEDWGTHVEIFDPTQPSGQAFRRLEPLSTTILGTGTALDCRDCRGAVRKADHTATLLQDGTVLIAGGWRGPADAQVFDGALRYRPGDAGLTLAHPTGHPYIRAAGATATLISDGRVVFAGGHRDHAVPGSPEAPLATTLIYNPTTASSDAGPPLGVARVGHSATLIHDDTIVIAGGMPCPFTHSDMLTHGPYFTSRPPCEATTSADVFTLQPLPQIRTTTAMTKGRAYFAASWLRDGGDRVLFFGGLTSSAVTTTVAEVADFSAWIAQGR
jgi:DNA-binding winged helix-turn-helix (wHTH) protein